MDAVLEFLVFALKATAGLAIYFAPTLVAHKRIPLRAFTVFNWNLFLGWTIVGWVFALVWAIRAPQDPK